MDALVVERCGDNLRAHYSDEPKSTLCSRTFCGEDKMLRVRSTRELLRQHTVLYDKVVMMLTFTNRRIDSISKMPLLINPLHAVWGFASLGRLHNHILLYQLSFILPVGTLP